MPGLDHKTDSGVANCNACNMPLAFVIQKAGQSINLMQYPGRIPLDDPSVVISNQLFPKAPRLAAPEDVPVAVERCYLQAARSLRVRDYEAAVTMYRKTLQVALASIDASLAGGQLVGVIRALAERHAITPALAEWAHAIRLDGNAAAHEFEEIDPARAKAIGELTRMVLLYLFTLPASIERLRAGA